MKPNEGTYASLFERSRELREAIAAAEQARPRRLERGDLFFLKMPIALPVTWCAVFSHSQDHGLWYCVPGDSFSLVSAADVDVPASTVRSELKFRCQCGLWIHAEDVDLANRGDRLGPDEVDSVRAMVGQLATDPLAVLDDDVGHDPDYLEWIDELRLAVDAVADSLHNEDVHSVRLIGSEAAIEPGRQALSLAADDATTGVSEGDGPGLLQRLQVFQSPQGRLQGCIYDDGVVVEWHPVEMDAPTPVVRHDDAVMEWFSQEMFWCTRLIPWRGERIELSIDGERVAFEKPLRN
ncbi:MAG: hypothetical protein WD049_05835 [Candidatus Paceibacterota bacterium]